MASFSIQANGNIEAAVEAFCTTLEVWPSSNTSESTLALLADVRAVCNASLIADCSDAMTIRMGCSDGSVHASLNSSDRSPQVKPSDCAPLKSGIVSYLLKQTAQAAGAAGIPGRGGS